MTVRKRKRRRRTETGLPELVEIEGGHWVSKHAELDQPASSRAAHTIWRLYRSHGPLPPECVVVRTCSRADCLAPAHLELRSRSEVAEAWARLTPADVRAIRERRAKGETLAAIAADYGIDASTVSRTAARRIWATVP
jgi:DNA-directed RNA polymerase specialized sigma24 family protein